ncbi:MAG: putative ABC exporter domain-containing protein [Thermoguttaceae bacterium]|jgi:hypothetical protein
MIHPALRKLLGLRFHASLRRLVRGLKTVRGAAFSVLGVATFVLWLGPQIAFMVVHPATQPPDTLRESLPLALLGYCLLSVLSSTDRRGIHFTPAEIDFLFSAPFTRRQLLVYKLASSLPGLLFATLVIPVFLLRYKIVWIAAFAGSFLAMFGIQLFATAVVLFSQTVAERAYTRFRRLVLFALIIAIGVGIGSQASGGFEGGALALVRKVNQSPVGATVLAPFAVFGRAITAERVFPDLVQWGSLAALVDLGLLGLVLWLDVNYLEAAIATSQKLYQRMQQARQGRIGPASVTAATWHLPRLPWLGGAGPIAHRQLTTALHSFRGLIWVLVLPFLILAPILVTMPSHREITPILFPLVFMAVFLSRLLPYDFRGDLDHLDWLKSLPLRPAAVAAGQLVVPVLLMTTAHLLLFTVLGILVQGSREILVAMALFTLPFNAIVFALDNLVFLLFPVRLVAATPGDFQHIGRAMVEAILKMLMLGVGCGLAAGLGGLVYWLSWSWSAFLLTSWLALVVVAVAIVPCIAWAYRRFDVSTDTPP